MGEVSFARPILRKSVLDHLGITYARCPVRVGITYARQNSRRRKVASLGALRCFGGSIFCATNFEEIRAGSFGDNLCAFPCSSRDNLCATKLTEEKSGEIRRVALLWGKYLFRDLLRATPDLGEPKVRRSLSSRKFTRRPSLKNMSLAREKVARNCSPPPFFLPFSSLPPFS